MDGHVIYLKKIVCRERSNDAFEESFKFVLPGYNVRLSELEGALGVEQVKRLPSLKSARRENVKLLQATLSNHRDLVIQKEIGESSWFGFNLVIRPGIKLNRKILVLKLNDLGFECRPIVAGNFTKNEVVKYFGSEVHGVLKNAEYIDQNGLFVGNNHHSIPEATIALTQI